MQYKSVLKKVTALVCATAMTVTGIPVAGLAAKAAEGEWPYGTANVMIDRGGYKTEVLGVGTANWGETYPHRSQTLPPATTYLTDNYRETVGTVPTSDWASSIVFDKYSESLYAHPLAYRAASNGMQMASPAVVDTTLTVDREPKVESLLQDDTVELVVGADGFAAKDAKVDKTTDWTYEIVMENNEGTASMRSILAKGTPYAYYTFDNLSPTISLGAGATDLAIYKNSENILGVSLKNNKDGKTHYYGIYAPRGTTWNNAGGKLTANLPTDTKYLSIAMLPDNSDEAFELYEKYAFNFITDTKVEWEYHENASKVYTRYNVTTTNMETGATGGDTIIALYPHQWRYLYEKDTLNYTYETIRGTMKTVEGNSYITEMTYHGILSTLPATTDGEFLGKVKDQLGYLYDYRKNKPDPKWICWFEGQYGGYDTYWVGKNLNTMAEAIFLADQFEDMTDIKNEMVAGVANYLQFWFDPTQLYAPGGDTVDSYFYYHKDYGTMIGYPASYSTDKEMNDHHFHYGYWIKAAAAIAMSDPNWADNWGGMVYELISDIANTNRDGSSYNENSDTRYPFLRNFDIYEGHSWASGVANYEFNEEGVFNSEGLSGGNNQESSSEAVNAWSSLILWGEAVGDTRIRDLGIYLYTTEVAAVEEYYYDLYDEVFTEKYKDSNNFNIQTVTRLFGGRYDHTAWWTENPIEVTTITMLPLSAATLYMGKDKEKVKAVSDSISESSKQWRYYLENYQNYGKTMLADPKANQDIRAMYYAYYDAEEALRRYDYSDTGIVESGESRAHTLAYITSLREYGTQNFEITGSSPLSLVFEKNGKRTYVAENTTDETQRVYFSDGVYIDVPAKSFYEGAKTGDGENPNVDESEILKSEPMDTPTKPTDPTGSTTEPTEPTNPTGSITEPTEPTNPTGSTTEPTKPTNPTGDTTEPTESTNPTGNTTEPTEPTGGTEGTEATDPTGGAEGTEVTDPTGGAEGSEPTAPTGETDATKPVNPVEPSVSSEPTNNQTTTKLTNPLINACSSYTKVSGSASFTLNTGAQGAVTFQSSNQKVATVGATGIVTVRQPGVTVITVQAAGNEAYHPAALKITLQVTPNRVKVKTAKSAESSTAVVTWKKIKNIGGYEISYATNKKFKSAKLLKAKKNATRIVLKKLKSGKKYYVRIRAYKKEGNVKLTGKWSKAKTVNVR